MRKEKAVSAVVVGCQINETQVINFNSLPFPGMLCTSLPLHEFFIFQCHRLQDFFSDKFPLPEFFWGIVTPFYLQLFLMVRH